MKLTLCIFLTLIGFTWLPSCKLESERGLTGTSRNDSLFYDGAVYTAMNEGDSTLFFENNDLKIQLAPIRENFKRINSIKSWSHIDTIQLWESLEGGEARYYHKEGKLEKINTHHFGETSQMIIEYYLQENELSFVFIKTYIYNLPIGFDDSMDEEPDKNESFDLDKSEIREERYYFENENLIHVKKSDGDEALLTKDNLKAEQNRILREFNQRVKNLSKHPN